MPDTKTQFATRFEKVNAESGLPEIYRQFILDGTYLNYKPCFIPGLINRGPTYVEIKWDDAEMLNLEKMYDERDIVSAEVSYHPIATIRYTHEFLSIEPTDQKCPIYIWTHEDGAFHRQFDSFEEFLGQLYTKKQMSDEKARIRKQWSTIKKQCNPAFTRARKQYEKGDLEKARRMIETGLKGLKPIEYTGHETDYKAIYILAELYNLQGLVALKQKRFADALKDFGNACECQVSKPALIHAILAYALNGDVSTAYSIGRNSRSLHNIKPGGGNEGFQIDPIPSVANFTVDQQNRAKQILLEYKGSEEEMKFAKQVMTWLSDDY